MTGRGRPSALSRERVLAAAVDLVDREGLAVLTMRRLATDLRVEAMSLYHHLPGKAGLLDGLVESVMDEVTSEVTSELASVGAQEPTSVVDGADWRDVVRRRSLAARRVMVRHPWAPALIGSRTSIPASVYGHYEATLATMVDAGFSYALGHKSIHALGSMVLGFVQELFSPDPGDEDRSEEELRQLADALPHIAAMVTSEIHAHDGDLLGWCDSGEEFEFTLGLLLDGLEAQRAAQSR